MPNDRIDKAYFVIMLSGSNMRVLKLIAELLICDEILKSEEWFELIEVPVMLMGELLIIIDTLLKLMDALMDKLLKLTEEFLNSEEIPSMASIVLHFTS